MAEEDTKMETEEVKQETPVAAEEAYVVLNFFYWFARAYVRSKTSIFIRTHEYTTIFLTRFTHEYTVWTL